MDLIKMYCDSTNIMPERLLQHFLRNIGFYVEKNVGTISNTEALSVADVYIISNAYMEKFGAQIDMEDKEKVIIVCLKEWSEGIFLKNIKLVVYREDNQKKFLHMFLDALDDIMRWTVSKKRLIRSVSDWKQIVYQAADAYLDNHILPVSQYAKAVSEQESLYNLAVERYCRYINRLREIGRTDKRGLIHYILLYNQYELNLVCKVHNYEYEFPIDQLLALCEQLLHDFIYNEELNLLRAEINFELAGDWYRAWDEYLVLPLRNCSYAYYKCSMIYQYYLKEYEKAEYLLKRAAEMNPHFYQAWFELAECYEKRGKNNRAVKKYLKTEKILKNKYKTHQLSPRELQILYLSYVEMSAISKYYLGNSLAALNYRELAEDMIGEVAKIGYLKIVWPEIFEQNDLIEEIQQAAVEYMEEQMEDLY